MANSAADGATSDKMFQSVSVESADPREQSKRLFEKAQESLVDGYARPLMIDPHPFYIAHGKGCWVYDVDGNRRADFTNNFTTLIHGHSHPKIVEAIQRQAKKSLCSTMPTAMEAQLAEKIAERIPGIEQVRFWNTGTESVMLSVKMARAITGRSKVAKIEGGYHGQYDLLEVSNSPSPDCWGDPKRPNSVPRARGTPQSLLDQVVVMPANDIESSQALLNENRNDLAAIVVCPVQIQAGYGKPTTEYLKMLRAEATRHGVLLIFDEVVGYRNGYNGTQGTVGVIPDITVVGKGVGGGLPIGAVGGSKEIMSLFKVSGTGHRLAHSGTFTANPLTMAAGCASLELFDRSAITELDRLTDRLVTGMDEVLAAHGVAGRMQKYGVGLTKLVLSEAPIRNWRDLHGYFENRSTDVNRLQAALLAEKVMAARLSFILSTPMDDEVIDFATAALSRAVRILA